MTVPVQTPAPNHSRPPAAGGPQPSHQTDEAQLSPEELKRQRRKRWTKRGKDEFKKAQAQEQQFKNWLRSLTVQDLEQLPPELQQVAAQSLSAPGVLREEIAPRFDWNQVQAQGPQGQSREELLAYKNEAHVQHAGDSKVYPGLPAGPEATIDWHEGTVNEQLEFGEKAGALPWDVKHDANVTARAILGIPEGGELAGPKRSAEQIEAGLAEALMMRIPQERLNGYQVKTAMKWIAKAPDVAEQHMRLQKTLQTFQTLDKVGTVPVTEQQMRQELHDRKGVHWPALNRMHGTELRDKYNQIHAIQSVPGQHKIELARRRSYNLENDDAGNTIKEHVHKASSWGKIKAIAMQVASVAFTVMSFFPPTAVIGIAGNAILSSYQAIKNKDWAGLAIGLAGAFVGGAGALATNAAKGVATIGFKAVNVASKGFIAASKVARAVEGGFKAYRAYKQGNWAGVAAGVLGGAAGALGGGLEGVGGKFADYGDKLAKWADRVDNAGEAYKAYRQGDYFGALGYGAAIGQSFDGASDKWKNRFDNVAEATPYLRGAHAAVEQGNYLAAAGTLAQMGDHFDGDDKDRWGYVAQSLYGLEGARQAIDEKNYIGAAGYMTESAAYYRRGWEDRNGIDPARTVDGRERRSLSVHMADTGRQLQELGNVYVNARQARYAEAANGMNRMTGGELERHGMAPELRRAAFLFEQANTIARSFDQRDWARSAYELKKTAVMFNTPELAPAREQFLAASAYFDQVAKGREAIDPQALEQTMIMLQQAVNLFAPPQHEMPG